MHGIVDSESGGQNAGMFPETPIINAIMEYNRQVKHRFHMPGHKGEGAWPIPSSIGAGKDRLTGFDAFRFDVTEADGMDDFHSPGGIIAASQTNAAELMGAARAKFLPNSTTSGVIASIMGVCGRGEKIILPRHVHRSVWSGLALSGAIPVYTQPVINPRFGMAEGVSMESYREAIEANRDAKAVLAVYPTFHGFCFDLEALAALCHDYHMPLIVDEAHGSHLRFHPGLPPSAVSCGADVVVQSWHKTLTSLTQTAVILFGESFADNYRIDNYVSMITSTSPSYVLMSSLDACAALWRKSGRELMQKTAELSAYIRERLSTIDGIIVIGREHVSGVVSAADITRIVVANEYGISGYDLKNALRGYGIVPEMAEQKTVTFTVTAANDNCDADALISAVAEIVKGYRKVKISDYAFSRLPMPIMIKPPSETINANLEVIALEQSAGRIAGESMIIYPPGIPLIAGGELISEQGIEYLKSVMVMGGRLLRPSRLSDHLIYVIKE